MANINVGELIIVNLLPTQLELNNKSITVNGVTKTFIFPVVFRVINSEASASVDYTYLNSVDEPTASFNPDLSYLELLDIRNGIIYGTRHIMNIPEGVTEIVERAFSDRPPLKVTLPNSLKIIGNSAFTSTDLSTITLPEGLEQLGIETILTQIGNFAGCMDGCNLSEVVFGNSLKIIGTNAFASNNITQIIIPNSVEVIGENAFLGNLITEVTLPATTGYYNNSFDSNVLITGGNYLGEGSSSGGGGILG